MLSLLDLPRELYLIITSHLQPTDLTHLAGVTRDHYLAAQEPLYTDVKITAYSRFVKLVDTLRKVPVVSTISPQQRLRWFKLSDAQLRERDIKHFSLVLDGSVDGQRITGAALSNCIGAVARKSDNVKIHLTLNGGWPRWMSQLEKFGLSNVTELTLILDEAELELDGSWRWTATSPLWDLLFCGSSFADLKKVNVNTRKGHQQASLQDSVGRAQSHHDSSVEKTTSKPAVPFYGLRRMEEVVIAHSQHLTPNVMGSLFGSDIIPQCLTKLEIVDCPSLHALGHLTAIAILLHRALQLVKHLKLHLCRLVSRSSDSEVLSHQYTHKLDEHPEEHPCNIVRELGKRIQHLDLALPFVCSNIFPPRSKIVNVFADKPDYPAIARNPVDTLPGRLQAAGYKYRRLICWHGICRDAHKWHDMRETAVSIEEDVSWELIMGKHMGSWHVGGCLPVKFHADEELSRPFTEAEMEAPSELPSLDHLGFGNWPA
ncbi:hypothetical protein LTS10_002296 [Elasticomyces elasticus]|nr:hypothetical protein LTS10_002296 [Elasticomyces elasticus]